MDLSTTRGDSCGCAPCALTPVRRTALAHGLADILAYQAGSVARGRRTRRRRPRSQNSGSTTRCFKAATAGRCRVPVKQALNLETNTLWLSDAGRCADVPVPAAERVQVPALPRVAHIESPNA